MATTKKTYFGVMIKSKETEDLDFGGLTSEYLADTVKEACAVAKYIREKRRKELKLANQVIIVYKVSNENFTVESKFSFV